MSRHCSPRISISTSPRSSCARNDNVPLVLALDAAESFEELSHIVELERNVSSGRLSRSSSSFDGERASPRIRQRLSQRLTRGRSPIRLSSPARELRARQSSPYGLRSSTPSGCTEPISLPTNPALAPPDPPEDGEEYSPELGTLPMESLQRASRNLHLPKPPPPTKPSGVERDSWEQKERSAPLSLLQQLHAVTTETLPRAAPRAATREGLAIHCDALLATIGAPATFALLCETEQRRRVHIFTRFLNSLSHDDAASRGVEEDDDPTAGDTPRGIQQNGTPDAEVVAESLADGLRRVDALSSLAAMANKGGYDCQLALSCLANLARLGLVDALCRHPKARGAIVAALVRSRSDDALAGYALPCAFNCSGHALLLRSMRSARGVTPVLLRWLHEDDLNELVSPHVGRRTRKARVRRGGSRQRLPQYFGDPEFETVMARCASTLLQNMRAAKQVQRSSIAVLRDKPRPSFPQSASAPTRLVAWLLGWRLSPSAKQHQASAHKADSCVEV